MGLEVLLDSIEDPFTDQHPLIQVVMENNFIRATRALCAVFLSHPNFLGWSTPFLSSSASRYVSTGSVLPSLEESVSSLLSSA